MGFQLPPCQRTVSHPHPGRLERSRRGFSFTNVSMLLRVLIIFFDLQEELQVELLPGEVITIHLPTVRINRAARAWGPNIHAPGSHTSTALSSAGGKGVAKYPQGTARKAAARFPGDPAGVRHEQQPRSAPAESNGTASLPRLRALVVLPLEEDTIAPASYQPLPHSPSARRSATESLQRVQPAQQPGTHTASPSEGILAYLTGIPAEIGEPRTAELSGPSDGTVQEAARRLADQASHPEQSSSRSRELIDRIDSHRQASTSDQVLQQTATKGQRAQRNPSNLSQTRTARALTASLRTCDTWQQLNELYTAHSGEFNGIHVTAMLTRLAALGGSSRTAVSRKDRAKYSEFLRNVTADMMRQLPELGPREVSTCLWALAKLQQAPEQAQVDAIMNQVRQAKTLQH